MGADLESQPEWTDASVPPTLPPPAPSGLKSLLLIAWPLIVSNSFTTIQITIDRLMLSWLDADVASSATAAIMVYWLPYVFLFSVAGYVATFVAQYTGAGRPQRVGPAVWQGIYFSVCAGVAMLGLLTLSDAIFRQMDHSPHLQVYESTYFQCMLWFTIPGAITAAISAFFSGRGESIVVIWISLVGTVVNIVLDYLLIFGKFGFPALGIAGAGWATVAGAVASALTGLWWMLRRRYRAENATHHWRIEWPLFWRLLRYGVPSAAQWALDITAFNAFIIITGWFSDAALAASGLTITINNVAFIPMLGVGQAVSILVGKHLGENNDRAAAHMAWVGFAVAGSYMAVIGFLYVVMPSFFISPFQGDNSPEKWSLIEAHTRVLLWFVAGFLLFDAANIIMSFALRGAGDTVFVSLVSLCFAWPVMVVPTYCAWKYDWGFYWAWAFATAYIVLQALCMLARFIGGKWRTMRVIEAAVIEDVTSEQSVAAAAVDI